MDNFQFNQFSSVFSPDLLAALTGELEARIPDWQDHVVDRLLLQCDFDTGRLEMSPRVTTDEIDPEDDELWDWTIDEWQFARFTTKPRTEAWKKLDVHAATIRGVNSEGRESLVHTLGYWLASKEVREVVNLMEISDSFEFFASEKGDYGNACGQYGPRHVKPKDIEIAWRDPTSPVASVADSWRRIEAWAEENEFDLGLHPGATDDDIKSAEVRMGVEFPDDLRESYRCHDGQALYETGIVYGIPLMPLEDVEREWNSWQSCLEDGDGISSGESYRSFPAHAAQYFNYASGWIPLTDDSGGNSLAVDMSPGERGVAGQVLAFGADDDFHPIFAHSWAQFLDDLATEYERGNFFVDPNEGEVALMPADPLVKHFHVAGITWSRRKLGLRELEGEDLAAWNKWHGIEND